MQGLRQKRKDRGLTQKELGKKIGASTSTVSMWETDEAFPRRDTLDKLCKFFNCKIDELM